MKIKYLLLDQDQSPVTGSSDLTCKIKRDADDFFFDFNDTTFKASGWTTIAATMSEPDATNAPGHYEEDVDESGWDDGSYTMFCDYAGTPAQHGMDETMITDGVDLNAFLQRLYQLWNYKRITVDATGASTLRNKGDSADLATGSITDDDTNTTGAKWSW